MHLLAGPVLPVPPAGPAPSSLEVTVERIARLILNAHALADRMAAVPVVGAAAVARDDRVLRLRNAVLAGQRGIEAAVRDSADRRRSGPRRSADQRRSAG